MTNSLQEAVHYPLLESLLAQRKLSLKGLYTIRDMAQIFEVSPRTIQSWIFEQKLVARNLPGRSKFLSCDIELLLERSLQGHRKSTDGVELADHSGQGRGRAPNDLLKTRGNEK